MQIKILEKCDVEQIALIERETFSHPWTNEMIENEILNTHAKVFCAKEGSEVLGYVGCHFILDEAYITNIAVKKEKRGLGISDKLMSHLLEHIENINFLTLEVRKSNEIAISLYKKYGFRNVGTRKNFYDSPVEDAYIFAYFPQKMEEE